MDTTRKLLLQATGLFAVGAFALAGPTPANAAPQGEGQSQCGACSTEDVCWDYFLQDDICRQFCGFSAYTLGCDNQFWDGCPIGPNWTSAWWCGGVVMEN